MLIKGSRRYNLRYNTERTEQPEFGSMINGQGVGKISRLRYGICRMSFNGCEVIAVQNALVYLKKPVPICEIAFYMERFRMLMGFFGCNPYKIGKSLEYFGVECERVNDITNAKSFIVTFWTKKPFMSSIHTVFCVRQGSSIKVYNRYNSSSAAQMCRSFEEVVGKRRPIAMYKIS